MVWVVLVLVLVNPAGKAEALRDGINPAQP